MEGNYHLLSYKDLKQLRYFSMKISCFYKLHKLQEATSSIAITEKQ